MGNEKISMWSDDDIQTVMAASKRPNLQTDAQYSGMGGVMHKYYMTSKITKK